MRKTLESIQEEHKDLGVDAREDIEQELREYASTGGAEAISIMDIINPDPTKDYYWAAETVYNEEIPGWEYALLRDHWSPVRNTDLPEMASRTSNGSFKGANGGYIKIKGSILYHRDKRFGNIDEQKRLIAEKELRKSMNYMSADFDARYRSKVDRNESSVGNPFSS